MIGGVRFVLRLGGFVALVILLVPLQGVMLFVPKAWSVIPLVFHRLMLRLMGVKLQVTGPLPQPGTLIVANHLSWFDIVVIGALMPLSFVAKSEVRGWPLFGHLARLQHTVFVDRRRGRHNISDGNELTRRLSKGDSMVIFAEGTNADGIKVLPFKSTLLAGICSAPHIPVQAMTMAYTRIHDIAMGRRQRMAYAWLGEISLLPHFVFMLTGPPLTVELVFHHPLQAAHKTDRKQMTRILHGQVSRGLEAITKGAPRPLAPLVEMAEKR
jgi:1-acyl-sn-glycerol-3-phosphate acyltransferase